MQLLGTCYNRQWQVPCPYISLRGVPKWGCTEVLEPRWTLSQSCLLQDSNRDVPFTSQWKYTFLVLHSGRVPLYMENQAGCGDECVSTTRLSAIHRRYFLEQAENDGSLSLLTYSLAVQGPPVPLGNDGLCGPSHQDSLDVGRASDVLQ